MSNEPQEIPASEPISFCLGPLRDTYLFLLSSFAIAFSFAHDLFKNIMFEFLPLNKRKIILEFDYNHQNSQLGELKDPVTSFVCSICHGPKTYSGNTDHPS